MSNLNGGLRFFFKKNAHSVQWNYIDQTALFKLNIHRIII